MTATPSVSAARLEQARTRAMTELLAQRGPAGHWVGELSSSALSTATAVIALALAGRAAGSDLPHSVLERGLDWLAQTANADGGWGDTTLSRSNLSTTTLVWAAFGTLPEAERQYAAAVSAAERWLAARIGATPATMRETPRLLASAILARYGKDRTFSVPILTACALAGRLGTGKAAWEQVLPLPFELAACPPGWFAALRLPVVSYALPALIAIGQARHAHRPPRNPLTRLLRRLARPRTLRLLDAIQPANGGFLEATPLTSFVVMSLAGSGHSGHPVVGRGVDFLLKSQRADGSWPIDTNLATWVTTLAINALAGEREQLGPAEAQRLVAWLTNQQYRTQHPYTHAAPGGWAWTDLPGGVPDADDTAGAVLALRSLAWGVPGGRAGEVGAAAQAGLQWLLGLQNRDGGIPTFCRGWGTLPFDRSSADLTAHALRAWLAWLPELPPADQAPLAAAVRRAWHYLAKVQRADGAWLPLWFGNEQAVREENPVYGTGRVVRALAAAGPEWPEVGPCLRRGVAWLLGAQAPEGGWGGAAGVAPSVEETAVALEALAAVLEAGAPVELAGMCAAAVDRGTDWLVSRIESGEGARPAPIGFYFANLWYAERLYAPIFAVAALNRVAAARRSGPAAARVRSV